MEIETKYMIPDKETADRLWEDRYLASMEESGSRETVYMKGAYFDTEDSLLAGQDIAFRIRTEGEVTFATLKWSGQSEGSLHTREEINVPVYDDNCFLMPDLSLFQESEIGKEVLALVGDRQLVSRIEMGMIRRRFRMDTGKAIIEVSIDNGEIVTDNGTEPICEVEFELFSGEQSDLEKISGEIQTRYSLEAGEKSKYARGLALAEQGKDIFEA